MSRIKYKDWAVTSTGDVVGGSAVEVRVQSTGALADLYDAATAGSLLGNPLTAEADGSFVFFVDPGKYDVTVGSGASESTRPLYALRSDITYPTIAAMALAETAAVGDVVSVDAAFNGGREDFEATAGGLTADGALVVDGVGVQWVSKRTVLSSPADLEDDVRSGFVVGARFTAGEFEYKVLPAGTTSEDIHITSAGGTLFKLLPTASGHYNFAGMNPAGDGVTDDFPKLRKLLDTKRDQTGFYETGIKVFIPNARFFMSQTIELKQITYMFSTGSGLPNDENAGTLVWPANTQGIVVNRYNTLNGGAEIVPTGAADGSILEGLRLEGGGGTDLNAHGVWLRARAEGRNLRIHNFAGTGWRPYAASNGTDDYLGNCNSWVLRTARITDCGYGLWAQGYDANAGVAYNVDASDNFRWGILDQTFLGSSFYSCHTASNGVLLASSPGGPKTAYAKFGGNTYHAVPGRTETEYQTTQPGSDDSIWRICGNTSFALDWTGGEALGVFREGGAYCSKGLNNRGTMANCYSEGGQGLLWMVAQHYLWTGGAFAETPIAQGAVTSVEFEKMLFTPGLIARAREGTYGGRIDVTLAGSRTSREALKFTAYDAANASLTGDWRLKADPVGGGWYFDNQNSGSRIPFYVTGGNDTTPYKFAVGDFLLGGGANSAPVGRTTTSAVPTSGAYVRGQIGFAARPVAGDYAAWLCTVAGTAGSTAVFKKFATIEA